MSGAEPWLCSFTRGERLAARLSNVRKSSLPRSLPQVRRDAGEENLLNSLCATVDSIKSGDFQVTPHDCGYCEFRSACRYVEVQLRGNEKGTGGS